MDSQYIKDNYYFETLNESHNLNNFYCEDEELNEFLKEDALKQQKQKLNLTKLIICDDEIIGFVSLLTDGIRIKDIKDEGVRTIIQGKLDSTNKKRIPAIKIGRFAIDEKYSNKGLGTHILRNIIKNIKIISENYVGVRFIVVNAYAKAYDFYVEKNQFTCLKKDEKKINEKLEKIIKQNPKQTFYLYIDLVV